MAEPNRGVPADPAGRRPRHPARRSFALAATVIALTLLMGRCSPNLEAAALPNWPTDSAARSLASSAGDARGELPTGDRGAPGEDPALEGGATGERESRGEGAPPPPDGQGGTDRAGATTTTISPPSPQDASFCRLLGEFVQPIRELGPADAGLVPRQISGEVERVHAGYRDDPAFELHGGAEDMLAIWRWAERTCDEPMAGQPARFRLVQFEDQLAGQGPVDVCAALTAEDVEAALALAGRASVEDVRATSTGVSASCTYDVDFGSGSTEQLTVAVRDEWGILEGSCAERDGRERDTEPADRACVVSSSRGVWALFAELRSRTVSIEVRWPTLDDEPPDADRALEVLERLYVSIAPSVVLGIEPQR